MFDFAPQRPEPDEAVTILRAARNLVAEPKHWCQGKGRDGMAVCLGVALNAAAETIGAKTGIFVRVGELLKGTFSNLCDIPIWNDMPENARTPMCSKHSTSPSPPAWRNPTRLRPRGRLSMFDFTPPTEPEVVRDLRAARALLEPGFAKGFSRRDTADGPRFCIGGAISQATNARDDSWKGARFIAATDAVVATLAEYRGYGFVFFNNAPGTTHADILRVFDAAITAKLNEV